MRVFDNTTADADWVADIEVARWEQYGVGNSMPFNAMWYTVRPGSTSPADRHPEVELSIVVQGSAVVSSDSGSVVVERGAAFLIESDETHTVENRSFATPLLVFSAYWMPGNA